MIKQFYFKQFDLIRVNKVEWFQVLLCIINNSVKHQSLVYTIQTTNIITQFFLYARLHLKQFYFSLASLHSLNVKNTSSWPIDRTLSGATTPDQTGHGSIGNKGVLRIPQSSSITGTSPSDFLVSYSGHSLGEFYPFPGVQSVDSAAPADWAKQTFVSWMLNFRKQQGDWKVI